MPAADISAALLDAIRESPGDDLPRLAYADWLEEQGDEELSARAAFIRDQLTVADLFHKEQTPEVRKRLDDALRRQDWWLTKYGLNLMLDASWCHFARYFGRPRPGGRLPVMPGPRLIRWHRGWPEWVRCGLCDWIGVGKALVGRQRQPARGVGRVMAGQPIEEVAISDVEIRYEPTVPRPTAYLDLAATRGEAEHLSRFISDWRLDRPFVGEEEAMQALSHACLGWARHDD